MLEPDEFLAEAQKLSVGEKKKVRHLCGDASLVVYNNVDSWTGWCWRCHARGWVPKPEPTMAERRERQRQQERIDNALRSAVQAPQPECHDFGAWPLAARLWLWKAGLTPQLVRALGAYYHKGSDRVVLPVREAGTDRVVFWQARNCNYPADGRPKYISCTTSRTAVHCVYHPSDAKDAGSDRPVVFTEDILSAFKVSASGAGTGYAVMATVLGQHTVAWVLAHEVDRVVTWFDPDGPGRDAASSVKKTLRYVGVGVRDISTDRDPKTYSLREIREILCDTQTD